jgi:hypothetical protein
MPVQLDKIVCSFCKDTFRPIHRARKKYCSDKCTDDAGNARKRNKRDKIRANVSILKNMKISIGQSREVTKEELEGLGFDLRYYSRSVPIWQDGNVHVGTRFYFEYYALANQQGKLTIFHY